MKDILTNKKNLKVFGIAALVTLIVLSSFSYAYFIGSIGGSASTDVDVTTSVNERLVFTEGNPIGIHATLDNFFDGAGSLDGETTTNVKLNAGSQSSTATELYQVYFDITTNDFEYSVDITTPELVLTITDPEGNTLTEATLPDGTTINTKTVTTLVQDGLGGTTSQSVIGFDVTEVTGIIKLYEDYEITNTNPTVATEQNWTAKITFINLDAEQTVNEGKTFNANLLLQQDKLIAGSKMISGLEFYDLTNEYRSNIFDGSEPTKELHKIIFNDTINETAYNNATDKWDVSEVNDGSVVAYVVTENTDNVMYIESNGKIIANEIQGVIDFEFAFDPSQEGPPLINEVGSIFLGLGSLIEINFNNTYDTSGVVNMSGMFMGTSALQSIDLSALVTKNVTDMSYMFSSTVLNSIDFSTFDTSKVKNMEGMFLGSLASNIDISSLNTSNVTNMSNMFTYANLLTNLNLGTIDTSNVTNMSNMFSYTVSLTALNLNSFNTSKVTNMSGMFSYMISLETLDISSLNTSNVTDMSYMFEDVYKLTELDVSTLDTSKVTDMSYMFKSKVFVTESGSVSSPVEKNNLYTSLDLRNFNTSNVINMQGMFYNNNVETIDFSSFDTTKVINMSHMFAEMRNLNDLDIKSFDTSNVTDMSFMFSEVYEKKPIELNIDLSLFDTSKVTDMTGMFEGIWTEWSPGTVDFDISNFDLSSLERYDSNYEINYPISKSNFNVPIGELKVYDMFGGTDTRWGVGQVSSQATLEILNNTTLTSLSEHRLYTLK